MIRWVDERFGDWENPISRRSQRFRRSHPDVARADASYAGKSQSDIVLGLRPVASDGRLAGGQPGEQHPGVFGMYGRIGAEVRENAPGLLQLQPADGGLGPGSWRVVAGVNPENVDQAASSMTSYDASPARVTDEELADNKANFVGRLPLQLEQRGRRGVDLDTERYGLGLNYL